MPTGSEDVRSSGPTGSGGPIPENDANDLAVCRETVEHPFGTMKARIGTTYFLTRTLPKVAAEMALLVLAYNLTRVMNIVGIKPLMAAIVA
jgi:hypothetical protein